MRTENDDEYQEEVADLHARFREACDGHHNQVVLHAVALLLFDALHPDFFDRTMSQDERIDCVMEAVKMTVIRLAKGPPS